jgi:acyl carrier protein
MEPSSAYEAGHAFGRSLALAGVLLALFGGGIMFIVAMIKASTRRTRGWIIGAVVAGVITLAGLLGAVGLAASSLGKAIQANKVSAERKKRVSAEGGRYRVEIPGHWKEMPELNEEAGIGAGNEVREQYLLVIENPKSDFVGTLDDFDQLSSDLLTANLENSEISEPDPRNAGKYPARHRRLVGTTENIRVAYQISSIESDDAFYQVLMWTIPSREAVALPLFREVVDSFSAKAGPPDPKRPAAPAPAAGDTRSRVTAILVELLASDPAALTPESRFVEDLGADSLDTVELVMAVEEEFGVAIPDETAAGLKTLGDLVRWIDAQAVEE